MRFKYPEWIDKTLPAYHPIIIFLYFLTITLCTACSKNTPETDNASGKNVQYIFLLKSKATGESLEANAITCYNPNLSKRWEMNNLPAFSRYASYLYKNTLFLNVHSTGEKLLYAIDINNGSIKWKNPTSGIYSGFTVKNDTLFAGYAEGNNYKLRALNISNGSLFFDHPVPGIGMPPIGLAAIDNFIYSNYYDVATRESGIAAYDYVKKEITWRTHAGLSYYSDYFISELLPYKDLLIFRTGTRFITAIERHTGKIEWTRLAYEPTNLQLVDNEIRVMHRFATFGVYRYFKLNPMNGEVIFQKGEFDNLYVPSAFVASTFGYYANSQDIYKFNLNTGEYQLLIKAAHGHEQERLLAGLKGSDNMLVTCKQIFKNQNFDEYRLLFIDTKQSALKDSIDINGFTYFDYFLVNQ